MQTRAARRDRRTAPGAGILAAATPLALVSAALATGLALAACGSPPTSYKPAQRLRTAPIAESKRERAGHITYHLASLRQEGDRVTIDLDLTNGFGRSLLSVTVWINLLGAEGETQLVRHPVGPVGEHRTERVFMVAREVPFQVKDFEVSVQVN